MFRFLAALLFVATMSASAMAHGHSHVFLGFGFGFPAYYYAPAPYYYPPAAYYAPPVYYAPPPAQATRPECRRFNGDAIIDASGRPFYGVACLQADGRWHIVE
jgi:hypothetical protein